MKGSQKRHVTHAPENIRPLQGRAAWWRRHPVAALYCVGHLTLATGYFRAGLQPATPAAVSVTDPGAEDCVTLFGVRLHENEDCVTH